jgi:flavin reductase (DIM6/NTAB) family NADH-FMN oxidoreductase RutF
MMLFTFPTRRSQVHLTLQPKILYFGTPVVLLSTLNPDGSTNIAPMSSAWWLGQNAMLGMSTNSQTVSNLERHSECVMNLTTPALVDAVDRLALYTGRNPIPEYRLKMGYQHVQNKFEIAGLTPQPSEVVQPDRVLECPVQLEGRVVRIHDLGESSEMLKTIEVRVVCVHIDESLITPGEKQYIDSDLWEPLIMNFCEFYGLSGKLHHSRLADAFKPTIHLDTVPSASGD